MQEEEIENILNNNSYWRLMSKIITLKKKNIKDINLTELAHEININNSNPYFIKIIELLEFKGFLIISDIRNNKIIQKINYKQLANFLRGGRDFEYACKIIGLTSMGYNY